MDTGLDAVKTATKKVIHKAGEFIGHKIADAVAKLYDHKNVKQEPSSTRRKRWNVNQIEKSIIKMEHYKIFQLFNNSFVS